MLNGIPLSITKTKSPGSNRVKYNLRIIEALILSFHCIDTPLRKGSKVRLRLQASMISMVSE